MTRCTAREIDALHAEINALRKQVEHDAAIRLTQADSIVALRRELAETTDALDDAVKAGSHYATALQWSVPSYPTALVGMTD